MKVSNDIIDILQDSTIMDDGIQLVGQLDTKTYQSVDQVIKAMGGNWDKKKNYHFFEYYDPQMQLNTILKTGEIISEKTTFQFFPTPDDVIDLMNLEIISHVDNGTRILEPSAGSGNIVKWLNNYYLPHQRIEIDCCEMNTRLRNQLVDDGYNVVAKDFLTYQPKELYDFVIGNPPFSNNQDIEHVMHMHECIRVGGSVVSVMSAGVMYKKDKKIKEFRDFVDSECGYFQKISGPAFKASGTNVETCFVTIPKFED